MDQPLNHAVTEPNRRAEARRRRTTLLLIVLAALSILVPFLFWQGTWFGRPLTEEELGKYLNDRENPRHAQHALVQIAERIERGDPTIKRWYPQVAALRESPVPELRVTLAWALGADTRSELFHETLLAMLDDPERMVRSNAALSLVRFGDASGKEEIVGLLQPHSVTAPAGGTLRYRLPEGASADQRALLAQVESADGTLQDIRAIMPGEVQRRVAAEGAMVSAAQEVLVLSPAEGLVWEALRALYLIGQEEDLAAVEQFAKANLADWSDRIRQQASLTADQIRRRSESK